MKSLKVIQTLSKIGKILSTIVFVFCIVGFCGCAVGILGLAVFDFSSISLGGITIYGLIEKNAEMSMSTMIARMAVAGIICAGQAVVSGFAKDYFASELSDATPFNIKTSGKLMRLGILAIAVPIGTAVIAAVTDGVLSVFMDVAEHENPDAGGSVALGVMFIVMSLVCRYGAELAADKKEEN